VKDYDSEEIMEAESERKTVNQQCSAAIHAVVNIVF
jgi:hypothetical protein